MKVDFVVIGIDDNSEPEFGNELMRIIACGKYFSGGKRHHSIVHDLLPPNSEWMDITVPLDNVFKQYKLWLSEKRDTPIIIFASGDPLFFGFAVTLQRRLPDATLRVFPKFNSLQTLAHRLVMQYHDMRIVSLTGRPWDKFDEALIERAVKIGILTDNTHTPREIAQRALYYGYDNYIMYVGEALGGEDEKVGKYTLHEASLTDFSTPNCIIMLSEIDVSEQKANDTINTPKRYFGIPDNEFRLLNGREKMITKMPVRLLSLGLLDLHSRKSLWDIGFCTGSISIESKMQFPHLKIAAFEIREICRELMEKNTRRFGVPGIKSFICDFLEEDIVTLLRNGEIEYPDAVFIGGHGGKLADMVKRVSEFQKNGDIIVFNSVSIPHISSDNTLRIFKEAIAESGYALDREVRITVDDFNAITCCKAVKTSCGSCVCSHRK